MDEVKRERATAFVHLERDRQVDRARRVRFLLSQTDIFQCGRAVRAYGCAKSIAL